MSLHPLPFRLEAAGRDSVGFAGIESVSFRVDGLLQVTDEGITLEWTGTRTTDQVSFEKIGTDVEELPLEWVELPFERIAGAWLLGGWWRPRLELRARGFEDFDGVPAARGVTVSLRILRRDRALARALASEIATRTSALRSSPDSRPRLGTAGTG
jgi:hypothetical protein